MKKLVLFICSLILMLSMAGVSGATPYAFSDTVDFSGALEIAQAVRIVEGTPLSYTHDINTKVDFTAGDRVTSATLDLYFIYDPIDTQLINRQGKIILDLTENATASIDNIEWFDLGEVDIGIYPIVVNVDLLNDDGVLNVSISVSNPGDPKATAWLDKSTLSGNAEPAPVPEPGSMALFGAGLLGLAVFGKRRMNQEV